MTVNLRATLGRVRILQFLEARDLSLNIALSAGEIGEIAAKETISNKRAWGSTHIRVLHKHGLVEPVGYCQRGTDTWAITDKGSRYLKDNAAIITCNGWLDAYGTDTSEMI